MFKKIFFLSLATAALSVIACLAYSRGYFSFLVDFSESVGIITLTINCLIASMVACFVYFGLNLVFKKAYMVDFLFNFLATIISVAMVFVVLKSDDPEFKNEDAMLMVDYYKGFVMPMLFFPFMSWMILKPLFLKK